jgi:hypothetical protein
VRNTVYQAVFAEPCDLSPEEMQREAIMRARSSGFKVEQDPPIGISRHRFRDGWSCVIATIRAHIPATSESHPSTGSIGQWIPSAIVQTRRRGQRSGAM